MSTDEEKEKSSASAKEDTTDKKCELSKAAKIIDKSVESSKAEPKSPEQQDEEPPKVSTIKHVKFVKEKIGMKKVSALPGIGKKGATHLEEKRIATAYSVLGHFLVKNKDEKEFTKWLHENNPAANKRHLKACYDALKEWCEKNLD